MSKVYMVRGRKAGIITSYVFSLPPTDAQMKAIVPDDEGPGWPRVHEASLLGGELPAVEESSGFSSASSTGLPEIQMSATGTVKNPGA